MIAANPGPAMHMALLGIAIVIALIVYAVARVRRKREAANAEALDRTATVDKTRLHEEHERPSAGRQQK